MTRAASAQRAAADRDDASAVDADVAEVAGQARAVDDRPAADDEIEHQSSPIVFGTEQHGPRLSFEIFEALQPRSVERAGHGLLGDAQVRARPVRVRELEHELRPAVMAGGDRGRGDDRRVGSSRHGSGASTYTMSVRQQLAGRTDRERPHREMQVPRKQQLRAVVDVGKHALGDHADGLSRFGEDVTPTVRHRS